MPNEIEPLTLADEHKLICERARRCLAEAQALMVRLDRLDSEWARAANEHYPCHLQASFNPDAHVLRQSMTA